MIWTCIQDLMQRPGVGSVPICLISNSSPAQKLRVCVYAAGRLMYCPGRIKVLAMKLTVRDWSPTAPLPHLPLMPNYNKFDYSPGPPFLVWQKPPLLALQSPCSPSAHSYPPIMLLSKVKTQQFHNATLYYVGSSHRHTHTCTHTLWGFHSSTTCRN